MFKKALLYLKGKEIELKLISPLLCYPGEKAVKKKIKKIKNQSLYKAVLTTNARIIQLIKTRFSYISKTC